MADAVNFDLNSVQKPWLPLREELSLLPGPRAHDGSPTWTLYDPIVHRYFRIGWLEFECLHRWGMGSANQIAASIHQETPIEAEAADVEQFVEFLQKNNLTRHRGAETSRRFAAFRHASKPGFWTWLLHNYLFLRIPLIQPDSWLKKAQPLARLFFTQDFLIALFLGACLALFLVAEQWSLFSHSFMYNLTPEGLLATLGMMSLSKVIHELGHALTASHFGCRVPAMGIALLLGMPVLWTDVTDSWRLPRRRDRLAIDAAGMIAELTLAVLATMLWSVLPDGPFRSGAYLLASTAWLITLGINLNPFMRFDGYYLLADAWDIPNLQDRAFSLAKWQIRESLFGFGAPPPEHWPASRRRLLLAYAISVWIYRLILFTGIAWAVYYFFFKALGVFLFAVEIGWFIVRPVWSEVALWPKLLALYKTPIRPKRSWLIPLALLAALFIPWQSHLLVPGLYRAEAESTFYSVEAAQVKEVLVKEGDLVQANQIMIKLASPDVDYKILAAELKSKELKERLALQSLESKLAQNNPKDFEELQSVLAELAGLRETKAKLTIRAPLGGRIRDLSESALPGEWLAKDEPLGIVENTGANVVAFAEEADLAKLKIGGWGWFYPEGGALPRIPVVILTIDQTGVRELKYGELASVHGGEVAVRPDKANTEKEKRLIPEQGIYRILLDSESGLLSRQSTVRGRLSLATQAQSLAQRLIRLATVALVKESGW